MQFSKIKECSSPLNITSTLFNIASSFNLTSSENVLFVKSLNKPSKLALILRFPFNNLIVSIG